MTRALTTIERDYGKCMMGKSQVRDRERSVEDERSA